MCRILYESLLFYCLRKPTQFQKILSYLTPVRLYCETGGDENPVLELCYYKGQYQLATIDALYSDGDRYRPVIIACKHFAHELKAVNKVLVLGTGLGSAVQVFAKNGFYPNFTLVDHDETVLNWAEQLLEPKEDQSITTVCADAKQHVQNETNRYDMLLVDVFKSRIVPDFVTSEDFLTNCKRLINKGGCFTLNYIRHKNTNWDEIKRRIEKVFPNAQIIKESVNSIIVATV